MILHIDCNCFYVSCELIFRPDLSGKPVVVANCNEAGGGIILALNKEAKSVGLKRGNPVFKVKEIIEKNNVTLFPANLNKYVDISKRIMQIVREQEIVLNFIQYSVDEFFGELPINDPGEIRRYANMIREAIVRGSGVPVSCGIAETYTLAKVATWHAKHYKGYHDVCFLPSSKRIVALSKFPVGEVWGLGRQSVAKLNKKGLNTAQDFVNQQEYFVKKMLGINGVKTWKELQGIQCIDVGDYGQQKSIAHSRTFAFMLSEYNDMEKELSNYVGAATRKLREQKSLCNSVSVFIATNRHRNDLPYYSNMASAKLISASDNTLTINKIALQLLASIFKKGYQYKQTGVILSDLQDADSRQLSLFDSTNHKKNKSLMDVIDTINTKYGMNKVRLVVQGNDIKSLNLKGFQESKNQSTNIDEVIEVNCKK